ncbi:MAG: hypothetical protein AB7G87_05140 [Clostridia bacterium]
MRKNISYHRLFIMMQEEDKGYGKSGKPTGYLKLEIKENKGKASVHIQNIGAIGENKVLKAYLLSSAQQEGGFLSLGTINLKGDYGDDTYEFSRDEVAKLGLEMSLLDTIVVICKESLNENALESYPLVGFEKQEWNWKNVLLSKLRHKEKEKGELAAQRLKEQQVTVPAEVIREEAGDNTEEAGVELGAGEEALDYSNVNTDWENEQKYIQETMNAFERGFGTQHKESATPSEDSKNIDAQVARYAMAKQPFVNGDIGYKWWNINDYTFILNNSYSNYNTSFSLYNPSVMHLIRRYGYFLFGVKEKSQEDSGSLAYAIPSRYGIEPHPFLNLQAYAYWIPKRGERHTIGALGYWVICMDTATGEFLPFKE